MQLYNAQYYIDAIPLLEAGFNNRERGNFIDMNDLGWCAWSLGIIRLNFGDSEGAFEAHQVALDVFRLNGNKSGEEVALKSIGSVHEYLGELDHALEYQQQAVILAREIGDLKGEADGLNNIGLIYRDQSQCAEATHVDKETMITRLHWRNSDEKKLLAFHDNISITTDKLQLFVTKNKMANI